MYNKTILRFGFCDIQNNGGLGKGYQPQPSASADNSYLNLNYSGYHKNLIQKLFILYNVIYRNDSTALWEYINYNRLLASLKTRLPEQDHLESSVRP